jgi:hypothetical protein
MVQQCKRQGRRAAKKFCVENYSHPDQTSFVSSLPQPLGSHPRACATAAASQVSKMAALSSPPQTSASRPAVGYKLLHDDEQSEPA